MDKVRGLGGRRSVGNARLWSVVRGDQAVRDRIGDEPALGVVRRADLDRWSVFLGYGSFPVDDAADARLRQSEAAVVMTGGSIPAVIGDLYELGKEPRRLVGGSFPEGGDLGGTFGPLEEWVARYGPRRPDQQGMRSLWAGSAKADETVIALLLQMGLPVPSEEMPAQRLVGCVGPLFHDQPPYVGETKVDWVNGVRWFLGRGADFVGIWDCLHPDSDPETWPDTPSGRKAAADEISHRVVDPILAGTYLNGRRAWAAMRDGGRCLVHYGKTGCLSFILDGDPPRTWLVTQPGVHRVRVACLQDLGVALPPHRDSSFDWRFAAWEEAQIAARAQLRCAHASGQLVLVPDDVERTLVNTLRWIRESGHP